LKNTIHIPSTVGEATERLTGVESLLTACRWERAAIVAAFVRVSTRGVQTPAGEHLGPQGFADLGISGLKKRETVALYVNRWLEHSGGVYPEPGADVLIPDTKWKSTRTGTDGHHSPEGMKSMLQEMADKHGVEAVAEAIIEHRELGATVQHRSNQDHAVKAAALDERDEARRARSPFNEMRYEDAINKANVALRDAMALVSNGSYSDDQRERMLFDLEGLVAYAGLVRDAINGESMDQQLADLLEGETR